MKLKKSLFLSVCFLFLLSCSNQSPDSTPPIVSINSPQNMEIVFDTLKIICTASDKQGIKNIELYIDEQTTGLKTENEPYIFNWYLGDYQNNSLHKIQVRATDKNNNKKLSDIITVLVDNDLRPEIIFVGYQNTNDIYIMDIDGTNIRQLTTNMDLNWEYGRIYFTPDGKHITFANHDAANMGSFMMNIDGKNLIQLTTSNDRHPQLSVHGDTLIGATEEESGTFTIFKLSIHSKEKITIVDGISYLENLAISADGVHIGFTSRGGLRIINFSGKEKSLNIMAGPIHNDICFSPGGNQITGTSNYSSAFDGKIHLYDLNSNSDRIISYIETNFGKPRISHSGTEMLFIEKRGLAIFDLEKVIETQLLTNLADPFHIQCPAFSRDDKKIIFSMPNNNGPNQIYSVDIDSKILTKLTAFEGYATWPQCKPLPNN